MRPPVRQDRRRDVPGLSMVVSSMRPRHVGDESLDEHASFLACKRLGRISGGNQMWRVTGSRRILRNLDRSPQVAERQPVDNNSKSPPCACSHFCSS